jgi:outer membrane protein
VKPAVLLAIVPASLLAQAPMPVPPASHGSRWYSHLALPYRAPYLPPVDFSNSRRIEALLRAGNLYLSLPDAIALALENNLDIAFERYGPSIALTDVKRTKGGGTSRGISLIVAEAPPGIGGPAAPLLNSAPAGTVPGGNVPSNLTFLEAVTQTTSGIAITGAVPLSIGPAIPLYDPALVGTLTWQRQTIPQLSNVTSGSGVLASRGPLGSLSLVQGFSTGTQYDVAFTASNQRVNASVYRLNPYVQSNVTLTITQPLLRGFGRAVNRRFIRIARNNQYTSDQVFRQQAIATVSGLIRLYWDLVSLGEDVKVKEETLALAQRLYEDNRAQVQQGTLAPVELTRAQAAVAAAQQDLVNSRGFERQQELIVKNFITRSSTANAAIRDAHIVTTSPLEVPGQEPIRPVTDLVGEALRNRPELQEARLQIENSEIALSGSRNQLLPEVNVVATAQNSSLVGQVNPNASTLLVPVPGTIGGFGTGLEQIFIGRYPSYSIGVQVNLPLRNRIAQADVARDEIQVRQWDIRYQQLQNQIRVEVEGALVALEQARASYAAAVQTRTLQEQSVTIELERYAAGISTTYLVLQNQSALAQARSTEVAARNVYAKARTALDRAMGDTLERNNVSADATLRLRTP